MFLFNELTKEDFDDVVEKLKKKTTKAYDFVTKKILNQEKSLAKEI